MATPGELVVTENEAARMLRLSSRAMQRLRAEGAGPPVVQLTNRRIGYRVRDLDIWTQNRVAPAAPAAGEERAGAVAYFPRPMALTVHPVLWPEHERDLIWALIGTAHPVLPIVDDQTRRALDALRWPLLGALRHTGSIFGHTLADAAAQATAASRRYLPGAQFWNGGLRVPVAWGVHHVSGRLCTMAGSQRGEWANTLTRAASDATKLAELLDVAEGGAIFHGLDPEDLPARPSRKEIDAAWNRFERSMKSVTGACGLVVLIEPEPPASAPPREPEDWPGRQGFPKAPGGGEDQAA